jgi:hypothetical protein
MKKLNYMNLFAMFAICFGIGLLLGAKIIQDYTLKCVEMRYTQYHESNNEDYGTDETLEAQQYIIYGETE